MNMVIECTGNGWFQYIKTETTTPLVFLDYSEPFSVGFSVHGSVLLYAAICRYRFSFGSRSIASGVQPAWRRHCSTSRIASESVSRACFAVIRFGFISTTLDRSNIGSRSRIHGPDWSWNTERCLPTSTYGGVSA